MTKLLLGAGSTVFAKNVLGDCLLTESLRIQNLLCTILTPKGWKNQQ